MTRHTFRYLILSHLFFFSSMAGAAAAPVKKIGWSPFMLSVYPDSFMVPRARRVYGLEVSLGRSGAERVIGFQTAAVFAQARDVKGFQIGTLWAESKTIDGFQIALLPLAEQRLRGGQIGLINNMKFEGKARLRVDGFQVSSMNAAEDMRGLQVGILNIATRLRGVQVGLINHGLNTRGIQIGAANLNGMDDDPHRVARGLHIGLVNMTPQNFQGVQIGFFNSVERLKGLQIGVINYVHRPRQPRLLLLPLINVGW